LYNGFAAGQKMHKQRLYSFKRYVTTEVILYHKIMAQLGSAVYHNTKNRPVLQPAEYKECNSILTNCEARTLMDV
jgi:hypothetical protein